MLCVTGKLVGATTPADAAPSLDLHAASLEIDLGALQICDGLTEEQLRWSPRPGTWSIGENLAHLRAATEVFLPAVDNALVLTRRMKLRGPGASQLGPYGRAIVWHSESSPLRLRAPKAIQPCLLGPAATELQGFLACQAALRQRMEGAKDLPLTAVRFRSPLVHILRFNLLECFLMCNAHARRHLRQAGKVRQALSPSQS